MGRSRSGKTFATLNPGTGETICQVAEGDKADVDLAVKAARKAFEAGPWPKMNAAERGRLLQQARRPDRSRTPKSWPPSNRSTTASRTAIASAADLPLTIKCYRYYAGWADKIHGKTIPVDGNFFCYTRHEPVGVVGQIIPWNFPLLMQAWKWGPALAAGSTHRAQAGRADAADRAARRRSWPRKSASPTASSTSCPASARPPARRSPATWTWTRSPSPAKRTTGQIIMEAAAQSNLKRVSLELGGKSPERRLRRRRPRRGRRRGVLRPVLQPGPVLLRRQPALRRGEDPRPVRRQDGEEGEGAEGRRSVRPGDRRKGRRCRRSRCDRIMGYIDAGKKEGAKMLTGGKRVGDKGYFIEPTVFADVKDEMKIAKEEIFGPVMNILKFKDVDEVIERGNQTLLRPGRRGLDADINKAHRLANSLRAGTVWVNCYDVFDAAAPFGGFKMSGIGRELGEYALRAVHRGEDGHDGDVETNRFAAHPWPRVGFFMESYHASLRHAAELHRQRRRRTSMIRRIGPTCSANWPPSTAPRSKASSGRWARTTASSR